MREEAPTKYMLLLRQELENGPAEGTPEFDAEMAQWGELMGELGESGAMVAAHGLDTETTATTVRTRADETIVTDGPFAETKESFFSYIIVDVADLDAALAWANGEPDPADFGVSETPTMIGRAVAAMAADPDRQRWNQQSVTSFQLAEHYGVRDIDGSRPDAWGYIVDIRERGLDRTVADYR